MAAVMYSAHSKTPLKMLKVSQSEDATYLLGEVLSETNMLGAIVTSQ